MEKWALISQLLIGTNTWNMSGQEQEIVRTWRVIYSDIYNYI